MSDTAVTTPVAVEAVVETPVITQEQPQVSAADRRQQVRERASGRSVAERVNSVQQPRDETGRFASTTEPEAATETVAADAVATDTASTEAALSPSATERIEIPAGNPLRDRGKQFFDELTPDEIRGVLNSAVRAREVESSRQQLRDEQNARLRAEAEANAVREQMLSFIAQPEIALKYDEIKQWNPAEADRWLKGVLSEVQEQVGTKVNEYTEQHAQQQQVQYVRQFEADARGFVAQALPAVANDPRYTTAYSTARERYGIALELAESRGQSVTLDMNTFINEYLIPEVERWPEIQNHKAQQAQTERQRLIDEAKAAAKAEAEADLRAQAAALQQKRNGNALGRIPANANLAQQLNVEPPRTAASIREQIRSRMRGLR